VPGIPARIMLWEYSFERKKDTISALKCSAGGEPDAIKNPRPKMFFLRCILSSN